jgi:hypothetical protein
MNVSPTLPVKTVPEIIAYAKANPGKVMFLSSGVGTTIHISGGDGRNQTFCTYPIAVSIASPYTGLHSQYCKESQEISDELSQLRRSTSLNKSCPRNHSEIDSP